MNSTGENGGNNNTDAASDAMLSRAGRTVSVHEKADEGEETRIPLNIISVMTKKELDTVLEWAALEKWNPSLGDTGPYLSADRDGFFINRVEEGGEPIASASGVRYGEDYGFVGLYICKPSHRGRGHGVAVFERAMSHLEGRIIGLDAVKEQQANYQKWGFEVEYDNLRFGGVLDTTGSDEADVSDCDGDDDSGIVIVNGVGTELMEKVVAFDRAHFPATRTNFLHAWLTASQHVLRIALESGTIKGYGVLRPSQEGFRVGPLFADSDDVAERLLQSLGAAAIPPRSSICVDVPEPNINALQLFRRMGLSHLWSTGRMYRGKSPELPLKNIYGITTLELG